MNVTLAELLQLATAARQLSLPALRLESPRTGPQSSRFFGRGIDFAESRLYQAGDDIRSIDWRVTARTGKAHTKLFQADKERQVLLWGDMRAPMFFATQGVFKSVQAALLMGYLAWHIVQTGNRLGGMLFGDGQHEEFRPALGKKGALPFLQGLAQKAAFRAQQQSGKSIEAGALDKAISAIKQVASPGSLLFFISDFRHLSPLGEELLAQVSKHCDLCLCFVYDPFEASMPKNGLFPVTDGHAEWHVNTFDKKNLERYVQQFEERRAKVQALSRHRHIAVLECSTQDDCFALLQSQLK